jgi:hypothetical protein
MDKLGVLGWSLLACIVLLIGACRTKYNPSTPPFGYDIPDNLSEDDIVGSWQAVYGGTDTDTLTIEVDGTFKQVFSTLDGYNYESSWNSWRIEKRHSGCIYVHLDGLRYYVDGIEKAEGMANGVKVSLLETCEFTGNLLSTNIWVTVIGTSGQPGNIRLMQMKSDADTADHMFLPISTPATDS